MSTPTKDVALTLREYTDAIEALIREDERAKVLDELIQWNEDASGFGGRLLHSGVQEMGVQLYEALARMKRGEKP